MSLVTETKTFDKTDKVIRGQVSAVAGQSLRLETSPDGEEFLNLECPAGKKWETIHVSIVIHETDA
jgi:hypothetical protein